MTDTPEITQEELDNFRENNTLINKAETLKTIENVFLEAMRTLEKRSNADKMIIGALLVVLEDDITKDIKKLQTTSKI